MNNDFASLFGLPLSRYANRLGWGTVPMRHVRAAPYASGRYAPPSFPGRDRAPLSRKQQQARRAARKQRAASQRQQRRRS